MRKFYSDDPTISAAFAVGNRRVLYPFLALVVLLPFISIYFIDAIDGPAWGYLASLLGSIAIAGYIGYRASIRWFTKHLNQVNDKRQFVRRAIRNGMAFPKVANRIASERIPSTHSFVIPQPRECSFGDIVHIAHSNLTIKAEKVELKDVQDFKLHFPKNPKGIVRKCVLVVKMKDGKVKQIKMTGIDFEKFEYELDKHMAWEDSNQP